MSNNRKGFTPKDSTEKLELAKTIAENSQRVARTYASVEKAFVYAFRWVSSLFNKILFSSKLSKLFALILAVILYFAVNDEASSTLGIGQSAKIYDIPVNVVYNSEIYEISGIPSKVDVIVSGDITDITLQKSQLNSKVIADLSGLAEGTYSIKLVPSNFISRLTVDVLENSSVTVTIKKKVTEKFNISYEFINKKNMDSIYSLGEVTLDSTEILLRASQDTIDTISVVKALIDVSNVTADFSQSCRIVAYDQQGALVNCDIIPESINASVVVNTLSKSVPITIRLNGKIAEGLAVDSISPDYSVVTIYAPTAVLETIDALYVDVDISSITKDTILSTALNMPAGVNKMDITKINMEISVGEVVTKVVENVPVKYINYTSNLKFAVVNEEDVNQNVVISGTQNNVNSITADDINVYIDMSNITKPGIQQVPLLVTGNNTYVTYELQNNRSYIEIQVKE